MKSVFKRTLCCLIAMLTLVGLLPVSAATIDANTTSQKMGDLDGDQSVTNKDVEYLLWHTLFPDSYPLTQQADFDGSGSVDNKDVEYLLWHTLFPESYPLESITLAQFIDKVRGVWIFNTSIYLVDHDMASFVAMFFTDTSCGIGIYYGEADRPGNYEAFRQINENTFELDLVYPAGEYFGDYLPETRNTLTVKFVDDKHIQTKFIDTDFQDLTYGGKTLEEAHEVAWDMLLSVNPTTTVISEQDGYRIIREDRSGRNYQGQVLISQCYDYVELTADTPAAKKINDVLKPQPHHFMSEEEMEAHIYNMYPEYPYCNDHSSKVVFSSEQWISVIVSYDWYMGGVANCGQNGYVFDLATGDRVTLRTFAGDNPAAFEAQLKQIVWEQISPKNPWEDAQARLNRYTLDTFIFGIVDNEIILYFPTYEFFDGAYGPVIVNTGIYIA